MARTIQAIAGARQPINSPADELVLVSSDALQSNTPNWGLQLLAEVTATSDELDDGADRHHRQHENQQHLQHE